MPLSSDRLATTLATRQTAGVEALAGRAGSTLSRLFSTLDSLDDDALARWLDLATPAAQATERAAASSGIAYVRNVSDVYGVSLGDVAPVDDLIGPALRSGTGYAEAWERPMVTARSAIARGRSFAEAIAEGAAKADSLARTNVGLASRAGSQAAMKSAPEITGYRRVPDSSPCSFCLSIATRRYGVEELSPAHAHCTCGVVPIFEHADPGASIAASAQRTLDGSDEPEPETVQEGTSEIGPQTP